MEHRVHVFARQHQGLLQWTSVGMAWRQPIESHGSTRAKVEKAFGDALRTRLAEIAPAERSAMPPAMSLYLVEQRLALSLRGEQGRRDVQGRFSFVVEYRALTAGRWVSVYHHPYRPEERVLLEHGEPVVETLQRVLAKLWADLDDDEIERLKVRGKERLDVLAIDAPVRSLREHIASLERGQERAASSTPVRPALVELKRVGVDLTRRAASADVTLNKKRPALDRALSASFIGAARTSQTPLGAPWQIAPTTRSFVVVGEPGSGRTTALERAAELLLEHDGYAVTRNLDQTSRVFRLSARTVLAGMTHLGEWEKRLLTILDECRAHRAVLAFDDVALLGSVGRSRESDRSFADLLEGPIARGEVAVWGETSPRGLMRLADEAPRLAALLTPLALPQADPDETAALLFHRVRQLERDATAQEDEGEKPRRIEIDPLTLPVLVQQARSLFAGVAEPQKSMHVLSRLAARLLAERGRAPSAANAPPHLSPEALVLEVLSERTGMPLALLDGSALDPQRFEARFVSEVVGQAEAARAVVDLALRLKTRMTDPRRPRAVYLLTGPTGTGKTETSKWIAQNLYGNANRLVRFDMAEYAVAGSAARLLGDRADGFGDGLAARVREQPFSVVLFDEIEKAHPSVLYLLLQLFDEGRLTDPSGSTTDFSSATILMTSNLGARPDARAGFATEDEHHAREVMHDVARAVREFFPPELFHRIDRIVPFRPLDADMARAIVRRELGRLLSRRGLTERRIAVSATAAVVELALAEAFDARRGARSVKGWLESKIGTLLADEIAHEGAAEQRSLVVYVRRITDGTAELAVHAELMTETPLEAPSLLEVPPAEDVDALRSLIERVGAPLFGERSDVTESLRRARRTTPTRDRATIYALEAAVSELEALREEHQALLEPEEIWAREAYEEEFERGLRVERGRTWRREHRPQLAIATQSAERGDAGPKALRAHLAALLSIRRALSASLEEPGAHVVDVLVSSVGERATSASFVLTLAAAIGRWGGQIDEAHGRTRDGLVQAINDPALGTPTPLVAVVMRVIGLGARARLGSELGTQVVITDDAAPELITVRLLPYDPLRSLAETFASIARAEVAFRDALEAGTTPLAPPLPLLPRLRTLRVQHRVGDALDVTIEDLRLGDVFVARVRRAALVLEPVHARLRLAMPDVAADVDESGAR